MQGMTARTVADREQNVIRHCRASPNCLARSIQEASGDPFERVVQARGPIQPGDRLFRAGDPFDMLYWIRSGTIKTETTTREGRLQVTGFFFAGDLIGGDCIGRETYSCDGIALETTSLCAIPAEELTRLCCANERLQSTIMQRLGQRLHADRMGWMLTRNERAELRVRHFLSDLMNRRGEPSTDTGRKLDLPMTKGDMANYLGLAPESLSRVLKKLEADGLIRNGKRMFEVLQPESLFDPVEL
ncbi:Crp/Fnr family transcriptional regulator [Magnetospira sp. QH-2]|uniref:Crp/Fnr family transcriptional regulator n=1 Tax=Magnetospira sp. (strain QH-2) TaxID=1288970 RepID=UPI0003E81B3B|nr:helix-turn-helix domain-containing protein [Magnetospira sp. QH-2]CCQ72657.1 Transcription regulator, Crp/Fnr family [Magnetospira sp. QH-2]